MRWVLRRSRLERAALLAAVAAIVTVLVVVSGVLGDGRRETASRLTAVCAPVGRDLARSARPQDVTLRDVLRLTQDTAVAADALREVIKDTTGETRRALRSIRERYRFASGAVFQVPLEGQAAALISISRDADGLGARCPSPLRLDEARAISRRLQQQR